MSMPIYVIACHGIICSNYEECGYPPTVGDTKLPTFFLDGNTILLNPSAGGEFLATCNQDIQTLVNNAMLIRNFALVTDKTDIQSSSMNRVRPYGVPISSFMRATNTEYPNIACNFDSGGVKELFMGVIEMHNNRLVRFIINPNTPGTPKHRWLSDVIQTTYDKTNTSSGIFIFIGCTASIAPTTKSHALRLSKSIDYASWLIRNADLNYNSLVATTNISNIDMQSFNKQSYFGDLYPSTTTIIGDADAHDIPVANMYPEIPESDIRNAEAIT